VTEIIIFDTSVFIDDLRTARHKAMVNSVAGLIRTSSVVLAELWRGATQDQELHFLKALERNHPLLTPTKQNWLESGEILSKLIKARGFSPEKLRDLQFDVLIALTARSHGALLITTNRADFELIYQFKKFKLEVW
jgi:predicted nucleic acid-binding protein